MTKEEALKIIQAEILTHAAITTALNTIYKEITGVSAAQSEQELIERQKQQIKQTLRPLPSAAANLGLGSFYQRRTSG